MITSSINLTNDEVIVMTSLVRIHQKQLMTTKYTDCILPLLKKLENALDEITLREYHAEQFRDSKCYNEGEGLI